MRLPFSKAFLLEAIVIVILIHRLLFFWFVTLDKNLSAAKHSLNRIIMEKEVACEKFAVVLSSLVNETQSEAIDRTRVELAGNIFTCSSELADLRTFVLQASVLTLLRFEVTRGDPTSGIVREIIRASGAPLSVHRCSRLLCIDWVSAADFMPLQHLLLSYFPFAAKSDSDMIVLCAIAFSAALIISVTVLRMLVRRIIELLHPLKVSALFLVMDICLSSKARIARMMIALLVYMSAFTVGYDIPSETFLFRVFDFLLGVPVSLIVTWLLAIWAMGAVFVLRATWIHERLTYDIKSRALENTNLEVARIWVNSGLDHMTRLSPVALIEILSLVDIESLDRQLKSDIASLLLADPFVGLVYSHRGAFRYQDPSTHAEFARQVASVLSRLGYREYPGLINLLLCFIAASIPLLLW